MGLGDFVGGRLRIQRLSKLEDFRNLAGMVVALGIYTEHWGEVARTFPGILNCCLNVCKAFPKEWDESTAGSGFDLPTRDRMRAKAAWGTVWEVAMCILREFGTLIILCNHGKHRSLSLAYELAVHTRLELVSIRRRGNQNFFRSVDDVMRTLTPRLGRHIELFGRRPHPVVGIHVCWLGFDGGAWAARNDPGSRYHNMRQGDILVEVGCAKSTSFGWSVGTLISGGEVVRDGWYPPAFVGPMPRGRLAKTEDLFASLVMRILPWPTNG